MGDFPFRLQAPCPCGIPMWDYFADFTYLDPFRPQAPYQLFGTQSNNFDATPPGYSASEPLGHDRYRQHYSQQTGRDPFTYPVTSSSGHFSVAQISGHRPQSQARSRLSECNSRPPVSAKSANNDRVESPPRDCNSNLRDMGNSNRLHVCHSPQHPSFQVCLLFRSLKHW